MSISIKIKIYGKHHNLICYIRLADEERIKTQVLQRVAKIFPNTDTELIQYTQKNNKIESHESPEGGKWATMHQNFQNTTGGGVLDT